MRRISIYIAAAAGLLVPVGRAQSLFDNVRSLSAGRNGPSLYGVSVYSGYSTSAYPSASQITSVIPGANELGPDVNYGISGTVGWQHHRDQTFFAAAYSGSYTGLARYSEANGFSQSLSISASRKLSPRWSLGFSASAQDATIVQFLNAPSASSITSQLPTSFDDLAAASGVGSFSTPEAESTILGAPVAETPLRALLLGNKILSYSGNTDLNYNYSRHISFHGSGFASGGQNRSGGQDGVPLLNYATPLSYGGSVGMGWSYATTPRTDLGASVEASRTQNRFQSSYLETATASVGRKMGMHWFLKLYGGATITQATKQISGSPRSRQAVGGGSLGIKTYLDTFLISVDRSASDSYGLAVGTYTTYAGTWSRRRPGSRLSTYASAGRQQVSSTGFESFSGWQATAGISQGLAARVGLSLDYSYFKSAGDFLGNTNQFSAHSVRLSMNWSPQPVR